MEFIFVFGSNVDAVKAVRKTSWEYGVRNDHTPYKAPYMVDFNWKKPEMWSVYVDFLVKHRPELALVPDLEDITQLDNLLEKIEVVRNIVNKVLVCVKIPDAVQLLPDYCRLAISVPTGYAGYIVNPHEIGPHREIHFLGGQPQQIKYLMDNVYTQHNIKSLDMNYFVRKAKFGEYFSNSRNRWIQYPRTWERVNYWNLVTLSMNNIEKWLSKPRNEVRYTHSPSVKKCYLKN